MEFLRRKEGKFSIGCDDWCITLWHVKIHWVVWCMNYVSIKLFLNKVLVSYKLGVESLFFNIVFMCELNAQMNSGGQIGNMSFLCMVSWRTWKQLKSGWSCESEGNPSLRSKENTIQQWIITWKLFWYEHLLCTRSSYLVSLSFPLQLFIVVIIISILQKKNLRPQSIRWLTQLMTTNIESKSKALSSSRDSMIFIKNYSVIIANTYIRLMCQAQF